MAISLHPGKFEVVHRNFLNLKVFLQYSLGPSPVAFNTNSHPQGIKISKPIACSLILKLNLSYACGVWADSVKGDVEEVKSSSSNKLEKLQINIFKQLLLGSQEK